MMNVLKNQSLFRPTSQPVSPSSIPPLHTAEPLVVLERSSRTLNILSLNNFKRPQSIPRVQTAPSPAGTIQEISYIETLSLRFSEAVARALAQPTGPAPIHELLAGKRPIPQGRGHALGAFIVSEFKSADGNVHLHRAIVRSLQKPLSVLLTNLSAYLSPLLTSPQVYTPSSITTLNPTQIHALAIATFAAELLEKFQELTNDGRINGLMDIREGLVSLVTRVANCLVNELKNELMQLVDGLEAPNTEFNTKNANHGRPAVIYHPSIVALQSMMPIYQRYLARCTTFADAQPLLATFLISIVWRAIVALAHRPRQTQAMLAAGIAKNRSPINSPSVTPPPSRFTIKLPPSRPASPHVQPVIASTAADAQLLYELFSQLPRPVGENESIRLAGEAVNEAFDSLKALEDLLGEADVALHEANPEFKMDHNTLDLPLLIVLPVLLQYWSRGTNLSIANMVGLSDQEYRKVCLSGFSRAEECETVIARRVLDTLWKDTHVDLSVLGWIENQILAD
ncbi:hypothetical protein F5887DRAFT_634124 [Amanita rubescens]|nr:hypothetical protein F5887DRAFT_634124 [Amanita rubescens]